jgi:subtilisin family serine protease
MGLRPTRTVLDAELNSLASRAVRGDRQPAKRLMQRAAARVLAEAPPAAQPASPAKVTTKLLTFAGSDAEAKAWIKDAGGDVVSEGPGLVVTNLPPEALPKLDRAPWVRRAEAPRTLLPRLDECRGVATGLDAALAVHSELTGQGVVFGIVDTGVDWRHADFRRDDGKTRLELFAYAHVPEGNEVSTIDEFNTAAIDAALGGGPAIPQGDPQGHGTHCASIAAGNGRGTPGRQFRGVAPQAAIMAVRSEPLLDTHTIWGIRRVFELAGNRPAVVSLSLGGHLGPHDGTTAIENVIARETGPGRVVVVASGNEGGDNIHWQGELTENTDLLIPIRISDQNLQFVDVWVPRDDEVDVFIETPDGQQTEPDGQLHTTVFGRFEAHWQQDPINADQNLTLFVEGGRLNHTWQIRLRPTHVVHGQIHAWGGTVSSSTSAHLFPGTTGRTHSIGMPATEERAISVGSWISRTTFQAVGGGIGQTGLVVGQLSPFSSEGPTRIGMLKPDIAAPGQYVTAALAAGSEMATDPRYQPRHHPSAPYITIQGTSMATPFVAGVVALMLQREPRLTPEEIQQRFRITAKRDAQTGRVWSSGFGFGKLHVQALLDYRG